MSDLILFLVLLTLGYVFGQWNERRHFASIRRREKAYAKVLAFATRYPPDIATAQDYLLVTGSVVVGSDYFKQVVAGLKTLFGGRLTSYELLLDRARREAMLRMRGKLLAAPPGKAVRPTADRARESLFNILENGRVVMEGDAASLRENEDVKEFYLGLSSSGRKNFRDIKHYRRRKRWLG